jgi:hypothetical protein
MRLFSSNAQMAAGGKNKNKQTQPDSALKSHSQEVNFGESRTSGARIPRAGGGGKSHRLRHQPASLHGGTTWHGGLNLRIPVLAIIPDVLAELEPLFLSSGVGLYTARSKGARTAHSRHLHLHPAGAAHTWL